MGLFDELKNKIRPKSNTPEAMDNTYEYCPNCDANLTLQKGYDPSLNYWVCKGCGEILMNPKVEGDIVWICDDCGEIMNLQPGFTEECGEWKCTQCGCVNKIDISELYASEDEFQAEKHNPYRGLSDEDVLKLSMYSEEEPVGGRGDITVVRNHENDRRYIRKLLTTYDKSIYEYLQGHPIAHMPRIIELYESSNCLIVIEEYIEGRTVDDILADTLVPEDRAVSIAKEICTILDELHRPPKPIVHRDIKPSNIIITPGDEVFLLDMNVAKWYDPDKTDDTHYMGTQYYAAPEQAGYGLKASSDRSDIYAVGMLLNVMITGHFPKEQRADGAIWPVIERCISLDAEDRYSAKELMAALEEIERKQ
jgi:hypothetical protein